MCLARFYWIYIIIFFYSPFLFGQEKFKSYIHQDTLIAREDLNRASLFISPVYPIFMIINHPLNVHFICSPFGVAGCTNGLVE